MTDDQNDSDDDEVTIEINSGSSTDEDQSGTAGQETHGKNDDILDEDGTVVVEDDRYDGRVRLVGTVHISKTTRDRVQNTIREEEPDVVGIELDEDRLDRLFDKTADVVDGSESEDGFGLEFTDLVRLMQKGQFDGDSEEILEQGTADMLPAVQLGVQNNSRVALIDMSEEQLNKNVRSNFRDEAGNLDFRILNLIKSGEFGKLIDSVRGMNSSDELVEAVQDNGLVGAVEYFEESPVDEVREQMDSRRELLPEIIEALIDERDKHLAGRIHWLRKNGHDTTAVMGKGHLPGVYEYLTDPETIPEEQVTEPDWYDYSKI